MKSKLFIKLLIFFTLFIRCTTGEEEECDYTGCQTIPPSTGNLTIKVSRDEQNLKVPISIYLGKWGTGILLIQDTLKESKKTYIVPVDQYITASATYFHDNKKTIVINDGKIKLIKDNVCDSICYHIIDLILNLQLNK
ncbi:MAG: hypothetical protein N2Z72_01220 [Bacteroidales bacterium]|nr:hypothetical protein [Bacteroidales bacterium]